MTQQSRPVKVRIAPSPTGDPHVGTGYIALFNYAYAKQRGGSFVLRIEDTDQARSTPESEQSIMDALRWLGIEWDEGPDNGGSCGPYRQSERLDIYREHANKLVDDGKAYWCTCTPERLAEVREKQKALKQPFGYDGHCRERDPAEVKKAIDSGVTGVVRLKTPLEGKVRFVDRLRGEISIDATEVDDQVVLKGDGFPTYHLANVVDDHLMDITHVIRGEEWISSTPKHVLLYEFFGWEMPEMIHLPLLRNADKSKVSKRKNPVSLLYFKEAGYLPDAMVNFLGKMAFTFEDEREFFSLQEFTDNFTLDRVSLGGPVFDLDKLLWINGKYLREKRSSEDFRDYLKEQLFGDSYLDQIVELVKERVEKSEDFISYADFFFTGSLDYEAIAPIMMIKNRDKKECRKLYEKVVERVDTLYDFSHENIEKMLRGFCEEHDVKPKELFMPIRFMVTGKKATPPLFETMAVLGRERCRHRMRASINAFKALKPAK
jgi:glutamyl-tRNA synthetase